MLTDSGSTLELPSCVDTHTPLPMTAAKPNPDDCPLYRTAPSSDTLLFCICC